MSVCVCAHVYMNTCLTRKTLKKIYFFLLFLYSSQREREKEREKKIKEKLIHRFFNARFFFNCNNRTNAQSRKKNRKKYT
jgi:hypothetical protein